MIWESSVRISRHESVSAFAVRLAPPSRKKYFDVNDPVFLIAYAIAWMFMYVYLSVTIPGGHGTHDEILIAHPFFMPGTAAVIIALVILRLVRIARYLHYNRTQFPVEFARWEHTWGCMRCAEMLVADYDDDSIIPRQ
jgi:hypothetical protein